MINKETAKKFLETNGYPNVNCNFENELLDTMVEYAQTEVNKLALGEVSVELPVYNIDFGGNVMAGIVIENGKPNVLGAMNGGGFAIDSDKIIVTEGN